jgi:RNA polymerase sigma factor (sigma-70 family)
VEDTVVVDLREALLEEVFISDSVPETRSTQQEETELAARSDAARRRAPRSRRRARGESGLRDARQSYMRQIQAIPLLDREQTRTLARAMRSEQRSFERGLLAVPGTAALLVEHWEQRRREGRVTAALSRHYRDGSGSDWGRSIDARFHRITALLAQRPVPQRRVMAQLEKAELSFELLCETYIQLRKRTSESLQARRALGLASAEGKQNLARASRARDRYQRLVRRFARHNLRLVAKCAHRFRGSGVPLMDLIQEGNLGLLRAIDKYDPDRGFAFSTYAVWWIQQTMIRAIQNQRRTVRVPSHVCELQMRYKGVSEELTRRLGREPVEGELAEALGLSVEQVDGVEATLAPIRSLHSPVQGFETVALEDVLRDERATDPIDEIGHERLREAVGVLLSSLDTRERKILGWRFGFGADGATLTLSEVGRRLGISRERARQIEYSALCRLRHRVGVERLRECLEPAVG